MLSYDIVITIFPIKESEQPFIVDHSFCEVHIDQGIVWSTISQLPAHDDLVF